MPKQIPFKFTTSSVSILLTSGDKSPEKLSPLFFGLVIRRSFSNKSCLFYPDNSTNDDRSSTSFDVSSDVSFNSNSASNYRESSSNFNSDSFSRFHDTTTESSYGRCKDSATTNSRFSTTNTTQSSKDGAAQKVVSSSLEEIPEEFKIKKGEWRYHSDDKLYTSKGLTSNFAVLERKFKNDEPKLDKYFAEREEFYKINADKDRIQAGKDYFNSEKTEKDMEAYQNHLDLVSRDLNWATLELQERSKEVKSKLYGHPYTKPTDLDDLRKSSVAGNEHGLYDEERFKRFKGKDIFDPRMSNETGEIVTDMPKDKESLNNASSTSTKNLDKTQPNNEKFNSSGDKSPEVKSTPTEFVAELMECEPMSQFDGDD